MACPLVTSGELFLSSALEHIDCQAQTVASFGYQALGASNSVVATLLGGLLTLFVALFGYRLMLGQPTQGRDVITGVLKLGIVLTLAFNWSAFRTLAYDTVLQGPAEIAGEITGSAALSTADVRLIDRLQLVDSGITTLTALGSGRPAASGQAAPTAAGEGDAFAQNAISDDIGFGLSRIAYLLSTLAPLALVRVAAGLLLATAPLFAGLLLFDTARPIFMGWLRALGAVALSSLALIVLLNVELAFVEPWMADALDRRGANLPTPSVPTELVATTLLFAVLAFGLIAICFKLVFAPALHAVTYRRERHAPLQPAEQAPVMTFTPAAASSGAPARPAAIAERLTTINRGERMPRLAGRTGTPGELVFARGASAGTGDQRVASGGQRREAPFPEPLSATYRSSRRRSSALVDRRDTQA